MENALEAAGVMDRPKWQTFTKAINYHSIDYEDLASFVNLAEFLKDLDRKHSTSGNRIYYLSLPPILYKTVAQMIGKAGLAEERKNNNGWSRIVVEKPFGRDLETAVDLDQSVSEYFQEHQIFRIDHYLAKETVQNILMLRFLNSIFEPIWNRRYIEHVKITPSLFESDQVRDEKTKIFRSLRPFSIENLNDYLVLGQYGSGTVNGKSVRAYREEPGVNPSSLTPTYAMMKVFIDNWRWQGVPFFLTSGKRLAEKLTEIAIQFKGVPHSMFRQTLGETIEANRLTLGIYPDEKITLTFQTKNPGAKVCLRSVTMDFPYNQNYTGPTLDAYEKVLIDCMLGDQMLFWRQDGVEHSWSFLTPILDECENCSNREETLHIYESGGWGPGHKGVNNGTS
jgi:glucose-6-phosphate 1-dehydrogenase